MQLVLKSAQGMHINIQGDTAAGLLKVSQLCQLLDLNYNAVRQRIFRGESVEQAIHHFLNQRGSE